MKFEETKDTAAIVANFKEHEKREVEAMMQLRAKNLRKRMEDSPDAKYCTCNKALNNNMIQCELCKDWFHVNCVPLPKPTNLKKQQGGMTQSAIAQMAKEVKFLCPICVRSRRPRLETILSLLVSLQKVPIRLPEGEALQCLTERGMSWQDRARNTLLIEEIAGAKAKLKLISQCMVEQAAREKTEKIISTELRKAASNPELKPHLHNVAQTAFSGLHNKVGEELKQEDSFRWASQQLREAVQLPSQATELEDSVPGVAAVQEVPSVGGDSVVTMEVDAVDLSTDSALHLRDGSNPSDNDVSVNYSMEHAYSTASKTATIVTPRKHARKSPLVTRQMESPVLQLSEASKALLEQLLVEGDLLEMSLDETDQIWSILQATKLGRDSFSVSPFSDIEENPVNMRGEKKKVKKRKLEDQKGNLMKSKIANTKSRLKIQLKENKQKKKKLRLGNKIFGNQHSHSGSIVGSDSSGIKHKKFRPKGDSKDSRKEGTVQFRKEMKDGTVKTVKMRTKVFDKHQQKKKTPSKSKIEKKVHTGKKDSRYNELDDLCSAASCLRPVGEAVNWVQCDGGCEQWFHLLCVGLDVTEVSETEDYICPNCANREGNDSRYHMLHVKEESSYYDASGESLHQSESDISVPAHSTSLYSNSETVVSPVLDFESASEVAVSVLAGFAKNSFATERMSNAESSTPTSETLDFPS